MPGVGAEPPGKLLTFARGELLRRVEAASERILLASPFLSVRVAAHLAEAAERSDAADRRLITALAVGSVRVGVLDPDALRLPMEAGFKVGSIRNLHAKVSIVDRSWALVGSGNLTKAGLGGTARGNVELGVELSETQLAEAEGFYESWWAKADPVSSGLLEEFDQIERVVPDLTEAEDFGPALEEPQTEELGQILAEDEVSAAARGYWIKSAYHSSEDPDWWTRSWISDAQRPGYAIGDLIVIYLGKKNDGPQRCPAIVRATSLPRKDSKWVIEHRDEKAANQWPYVTETAFVADVSPVTKGVDLSLIGKGGRSVQRGNCRISREEFEVLARVLRSSPGVLLP